MSKSLIARMKSIRFTLLTIVLLCWLLPTCILGFYLGTQFSASLKEKTESALISAAWQAQTLTLRNLDMAVALGKSAVYDDEINQYTQDYRSGRQTYEAYYRLTRGYLDRKFSREESCTRAFFLPLSGEGELIYTSKDYASSLVFAQQDMPSILALCEDLDTRSAFYPGASGVYLIRNLFDTRLSRYGILALGLDMEALLLPLHSLSLPWDYGLAVSLDSYQLGDFLGAEAGLNQAGNNLCCTLEMDQEDYRLRFQVQIPTSQVYREMNAFYSLMLWLLALLLPLYAGVMAYVNRRIVRPIALLSQAAGRIQNGEWGLTVPMRGMDELGKLGLAFSTMSLRLKELIDRSYKEEIALRDAKIQAMQSRINPHFLNNALEAINWQCRMEGSDTAAQMVETLSVLLNASLDRNDRHLVPLREEMSIAEAYFYFVHLRFGERLTILPEVSDAAQTALVPRLAVQTLIENAVEHGVAPAGGGAIGLRAWVQEERLVVEVSNSGQRLTAEEFSRIRSLLQEGTPGDGHLGVRNVAQRLRLLFGSTASLTYLQDAQGQTVARMQMPLQTQESPVCQA